MHYNRSLAEAGRAGTGWGFGDLQSQFPETTLNLPQPQITEQLKNMVDTHEMLIRSNFLPNQPTSAAMVA